MASSSNKTRKRVEAESTTSSLKRAKDGSAFAKCEECNKDVPVALISFHSCSLDAKIKMNLDTTVVELAENKKKSTSSAEKKTSEKKPKKKLAKKDGKKRPPTAFFVFMNDFRKTFKEENPECKSVATVAKEGGVKWKAMSDEERKVYIDKAAELKIEYENEALEDKEDVENEKDDVVEIEDKDEDVEIKDEKEVKEEELKDDDDE